MAGALGQLRSFISGKLDQLSTPSPRPSVAGDGALDPHPSVGFQVSFNPSSSKLRVTVLGARHLPANAGHVPAAGYLVKVKLYPGRDKYETESKPESWPTYNQHFDFPLPATNNNLPSKSAPPIETVLTTSKFLTLTIFAVDKLQKRKPLGSATWPLDHKLFAPKRAVVGNGVVETAEMWKRVTDLSSGVTAFNSMVAKRIMHRAKDQLEVSVCHVTGAEGEDGLLRLRVARLRWGIDKAKEYQHKEAELYVKLSVTNCFGQVMRCQKTASFAPSISVAWPPDDIKSALQVSVPPLGPRNKGYTCVLMLCAKVGRAGKKVHLGRVLIPQSPEQPEVESDHWTLAMQSPDTPVTQWHNLVCDTNT